MPKLIIICEEGIINVNRENQSEEREELSDRGKAIEEYFTKVESEFRGFVGKYCVGDKYGYAMKCNLEIHLERKRDSH